MDKGSTPHNVGRKNATMAHASYFLTWTTYGSWLHGDARGSVDSDHNLVGHPVVAPDNERYVWNDGKLAESAFTLNPKARAIVGLSICETARNREWKIVALHVGVNHVHVVLDAPDVEPQTAVKSLKSWATRALRDAGALDDRTRVWTKRASTRYLNSDASKAAAVDYVRRFQ